MFELEDGELTFPYHFHHGVEEWPYVIAGTPIVRMPAGERVLQPGDLICFPSGAAGAHTVRGPGRVMILSANHVPSISAYPDSGKIGTRPRGLGGGGRRIWWFAWVDRAARGWRTV